jgi:hypothetical protein
MPKAGTGQHIRASCTDHDAGQTVRRRQPDQVCPGRHFHRKQPRRYLDGCRYLRSPSFQRRRSLGVRWFALPLTFQMGPATADGRRWQQKRSQSIILPSCLKSKGGSEVRMSIFRISSIFWIDIRLAYMAKVLTFRYVPIAFTVPHDFLYADKQHC